jgi:hypothetical protein
LVAPLTAPQLTAAPLSRPVTVGAVNARVALASFE